MRSDVPEVVLALRQLLPLVKSCKSQLTSQEVGMVLHGFSAMTADGLEVRSLLSALSELILNSKVKLETDALSSAVQGLKGFDFELVEIKQIFAALSTNANEVNRVMNRADEMCSPQLTAIIGDI